MVKDLMRVILSMEGFIYLAVCVTTPLSIVFYVLSKRYRWNDSLSAYVGLFYKLEKKSSVYLSANYLRILLLVWMIFNVNILNLSVQILHISLLLICILFYPNRKSTFVLVINGILTQVALVFANILLDYSRLVQINVDLEIVYILFGVFIVLYNIYYFIKSLLDISNARVLKLVGENNET